MLDNISILIYHKKMTGNEIIDKLKEFGWTLDRVTGSHHVMVKDGKAVPVHGKRDIGAVLLAAIQRQTGVIMK
jgi:predicted RNA binding protein YcfA (HicA-like mRNA interferase family)